MSPKPLLDCCLLQGWEPRHLNKVDGSITAEEIAAEVKEILEANLPKIGLKLIKVARALDFNSVEMIELKAAALTLLHSQSDTENQQQTKTNQENEILVRGLLNDCQAEQWQPQFLTTELFTQPVSEVETKILEEAEAARNNGASELSLLLLDRALQHGYESPWLLHSKALTLSQLKRFKLAHEIWEKLKAHVGEEDLIEDITVAHQTSKQELAAVEATDLLNQLHELATQRKQCFEYIPEGNTSARAIDLQHTILLEAEKLRFDNKSDLSIEVIDLALAYGCDSLWLLHNKALGLQSIGKTEEAIAIWDKLSEHKIDGFSQNVSKCRKEAKVELLTNQAEKAASSNCIDNAMNLLADALIINPKNEKLILIFKNILNNRREGDKIMTDTPEHREQLDQLEINKFFINRAKVHLHQAKAGNHA